MTQVYNGSEYPVEKARKKRFLTIWYILFGLVFAIDVGLIVWHALMPYKSPDQIIPKVIAMSLSSVFAVISLLLFSTKFRRLRCYVKMLGYLQTGLKEGSVGEFLEFSEKVEVHEGVDFYNFTLYEWNEIKQEYFIRKVLVDNEKPKPELKEGDMVHFITQGNILMEYEVIPRPENEPTAEYKRESVLNKDRREKIKRERV